MNNTQVVVLTGRDRMHVYVLLMLLVPLSQLLPSVFIGYTEDVSVRSFPAIVSDAHVDIVPESPS